jgi:hypothetical protein
MLVGTPRSRAPTKVSTSRPRDEPLQRLSQRRAARRFDHGPEHDEARIAVREARTGRERRRGLTPHQVVAPPRVVRIVELAIDDRVVLVVGVAARMAEQLAHGDLPGIRHVRRHVLGDRVVETKAAALDEPEDNRVGEQLRDARQRVHRIERHGPFRTQIRDAAVAVPHDAAVHDDRRGRAGRSGGGSCRVERRLQRVGASGDGARDEQL